MVGHGCSAEAAGSATDIPGGKAPPPALHREKKAPKAPKAPPPELRVEPKAPKVHPCPPRNASPEQVAATGMTGGASVRRIVLPTLQGEKMEDIKEDSDSISSLERLSAPQRRAALVERKDLHAGASVPPGLPSPSGKDPGAKPEVMRAKTKN